MPDGSGDLVSRLLCGSPATKAADTGHRSLNPKAQKPNPKPCGSRGGVLRQGMKSRHGKHWSLGGY